MYTCQIELFFEHTAQTMKTKKKLKLYSFKSKTKSFKVYNIYYPFFVFDQYTVIKIMIALFNQKQL